MLLAFLGFATIILTFAMFYTRNSLLGFPCTIFWAILSGYCYQQSTTTWDVYYLTFFASAGMAIFSTIAMYALRNKDLSGPDADEGKFFDEEQEPDLWGDAKKGESEEQPSSRVKAVRDRAAKRRSQGIEVKRTNQGGW